MSFDNKNHEGNSTKYHTGKPCIVKGCDNPAGTWWSPYYCVDCNIARMSRIDTFMSKLEKESD